MVESRENIKKKLNNKIVFVSYRQTKCEANLASRLKNSAQNFWFEISSPLTTNRKETKAKKMEHLTVQIQQRFRILREI